MYNPKSTKATEFIDHQEILDSLEYARANKNNTELIEGLIERARDCKGLSHREAALLLECDDPVLVDKMYHVAKEIKQKFYGNQNCMFAPSLPLLIIVSIAVFICPYHCKMNKQSAVKN